MADTHVANQGTHVARPKHVTHQATAFVHIEGVAIGGDNPGGILSAMLQDLQAVVEELIDRALADDS